MSRATLRTSLLLIAGAMIGVVAWGSLRFVLTPWPEPPHYHANWALIVNGEALDFSADRYMESVAACAATDVVQPTETVHMHNNVGSVVHVHATGVAWSHFFANIGIAVGTDYLMLDGGRRFIGDDGGTLKIVINGFVVGDISSRVVRSGDRLLLSYGPESAEEVLNRQFTRVSANAESYNERIDPAGCAGTRSIPTRERLRRAFWGYRAKDAGPK